MRTKKHCVASIVYVISRHENAPSTIPAMVSKLFQRAKGLEWLFDCGGHRVYVWHCPVVPLSLRAFCSLT
jgi:hypothetical protein